jgi:hypothetical protein
VTAKGDGVVTPAVVAHADWSKDSGKRWMAVALRDARVWRLTAPERVGSTADLFDRLAARARVAGPLIVGFDFPIGLPAAYGARTGLPGFRAALGAFGKGDWAAWYDVCDRAEEISLRRPFYPMRPGGRRRAHLTAALGLAPEHLFRRCDHATASRGAACAMFWTLGGNQVGKAAITGWRDLLAPSLHRIGLWPFDGGLAALLSSRSIVVAETYPGDLYARLGLPPKVHWSKRRQDDRRRLAPALLPLLEGTDRVAGPDLRALLEDGFGRDASGEDRFDALIGLLGMLEVVAGRLPEGAPEVEAVRRWEGWILGQDPTPSQT